MNAPATCPYLALDPEAHRNPQSFFDSLRARQDIPQDPTTGFYLVSKPDTIRTIFQDSDTYSSADAFSPALTEATHYLMDTLTDEQRQHFVSPVVTIMTSEGATHQRLRKAVNPYFTKAAMRQRHSAVGAMAGTVLDRLQADADWVQDFCMPFTVRVIADLLGVPYADYDTITRWDRFLTSLATGANLPTDAVSAYVDFTKEFTEYFRDRAAGLADNPDGSLLSHLVQQGDNLTDHERIQFLLILFPAGSTTTVILLTHIAIRLAQDPELIRKLRTDHDAIATFVEECIVERTPSANVFRTTTRDVILQGTPIPAGSPLLLILAAANQDIPDDTSHLSFGYGVHRCLGAQLARTEARAALAEIIGRYERISLTQPLDALPFYPHLLIPAYHHLPVHLEPAR